MTPLPSVVIEGLNVSFGESPVLAGFSATFSSGDVVRIAGRNGTGKTTLLRVLSGLHTDYTGRVSVGSNARQLGDRLPLVSSPPELFPYLTVREHLAMLKQISRDAGRVPASINTDQLGLAGVMDSLAETLSLGQRQRLSLAALLLTDCDIWLLDEPFNGLDPEGVDLLRDLIELRAASGGIVLVATHTAAHVAGLATSTIELRGPSTPVGPEPT